MKQRRLDVVLVQSAARHLAQRSRRTVVACVAVVVVVTGLAGCSSAAAPEPTYGGLPSWLPTPTQDTDQTLPGSQASPALTVQGEAVLAELPQGGTVLITVSGPEVPGEGLPDPPAATVCTWTITLAEGSVPVAIDPADFATQDSLGAVYHPVLVPGQPEPPNVLPAGQSASFELRTTMPTGEGIMQWAPDGRHPVATWDFVVEND
ncbi:MAG: hypothetical protein FWF43_07185 [Propionibacteriaceae bacterium]|nr:hypothetical protein [Propionibacteriaceae bacterium]